MQILREPKITLIARPEFLEPAHMAVQWKGEGTGGERLAEFAGRVCYMSQKNPASRTTRDYLENIKKQGHGSVLEHAVYWCGTARGSATASSASATCMNRRRTS